MKWNGIYLVWCLPEQQQIDTCMAELIYDRMNKKANTNCPKKPKTNINKELAIETVKLNRELDYKAETIRKKLDYAFKLCNQTE